MVTLSEAVAAFEAELGRIESERRQPSIAEEVLLRAALKYIEVEPILALEILAAVRHTPRSERLARLSVEPKTIEPKTIDEWRAALRRWTH